MADEPAYMRNLRLITRGAPNFGHLVALEGELYSSANDRAVVILSVSFVEANLEALIVKAMRGDLTNTDRRRLFEGDGSLSRFSSKISVAYALGLIGRISRSDLDLIRFLRNEFAHSRMPFGFQTKEVIDFCTHLKIVDDPQTQIPYAYLTRSPIEDGMAARDLTNAKTRFIATCHNLSYRLLVKTLGPREGDFAYPNNEPMP